MATRAPVRPHHEGSLAEFDPAQAEESSESLSENENGHGEHQLEAKPATRFHESLDFIKKNILHVSDRIKKPEVGNFSFRQIKEMGLSKNLIISNLNPTLIKWDLFVILLAIYSCITIPLSLSFRPKFLSEAHGLNNFVDICFSVDILIMFRTTSINLNTGVEITKGRDIAIAYLKSRFFIDFVSAVPIDKVIMWFVPDDLYNEEHVKHFVALSCLKMVRILRINRLLIFLNSSSDFKLQIKLYKMCFFLLLYIHFTACLWYFIIVIIRYEETDLI